MNDMPEVEIPGASTTHLTIANIHLEISFRDIQFNQENEHIYQQFIIPPKDDETINIPVTILAQDPRPLIKSLKKIFDTGEAWSLYSDSKNKFIVSHLQDKNKGPAWLAKIKPDRKGITVYCSSVGVGMQAVKNSITNPVRYPLDQILLVNFLLDTGLLIHAAGIVIDGRGYLLAGHSGAGKSTLCRLLAEQKKITILSDDRIVIKRDKQGFLMYGTPWPGEAGIAVNDCAALQSIFFLNHAESNNINELAPGEALKYLFKVGSLPWYDENDLQMSFDFCDALLQEIKTYELNFRPDPEIIETIMSFVSG